MSAVEKLPDPTKSEPTPRGGSSGRGPTTGTDQGNTDTQDVGVGSGPLSGVDREQAGTHIPGVDAGSTSLPDLTMLAASPSDASSGSGGDGPDDPIQGATSSHLPGRRDQDLLLYLFADQLGDVEGLRIATENRLRSLIDTSAHGKGVPDDLPEVAAIRWQLDQLVALEHAVTLQLKRAMRAHYLGPWCKATVGVGEKQLGRLLAVIGDPATRERPSQLWAYCGLHVLHPGRTSRVTQICTAGVDPTSDPGQRASDTQGGLAGVAPTRTRGQRANWSTEAKTRTYLIAESCIKNRRSPYRAVYDHGRAKYAEAVHQHPCKRCGPAGKPAQPSSDLSDGHKHARAMRLVMKQVLLDLWKEAIR